MTLTAALLIILSAFMHAGWNFVSKRRSPTLAFFAIAALSGAVVMLPWLLMNLDALRQMPRAFWGLVACTGVAQLIYIFGLAGAYRRGDISLAYPLARALPVLMVAAISPLLRQNAALTRIGLLGMLLITIGCIILPLSDFRQIKLENYLKPVCLMALIAAVGTTSYTLIDDQALKIMRPLLDGQLLTREITLLFMSVQVGSTAVAIVIGTLLISAERKNLFTMLHDRSLVVTGLVTGVVIAATYGLALAAMAFVTNVAYVAAFRQLSIPIGALLGIVVQQEPCHRPKLLGIVIVSIGLILVGLA